jgi:glycerol-3-phosphate acyltransferase PlsX
MLKPMFSYLSRKLDYNQFGGASLLGVNGAVVIAHGRSNALAIESAIDVAYRAVKVDLNKTIAKGISGWGKHGG